MPFMFITPLSSGGVISGVADTGRERVWAVDIDVNEGFTFATCQSAVVRWPQFEQSALTSQPTCED
jgi:hypothetical protein